MSKFKSKVTLKQAFYFYGSMFGLMFLGAYICDLLKLPQENKTPIGIFLMSVPMFYVLAVKIYSNRKEIAQKIKTTMAITLVLALVGLFLGLLWKTFALLAGISTTTLLLFYILYRLDGVQKKSR